MPTYDELIDALKRADQAGDVEAAQAIARTIKAGQTQNAAAPEPEVAPVVQQTEPESSFARDALKRVEYGTSKVGAGLANLVGLPVDLSVLGLNAAMGAGDLLGIDDALGFDMPYIDGSRHGSNALKRIASDAYESVGGDVLEGDELSPLQRVLGKGVEIGTEAIVPAAGLARVASKAAAPANSMLRNLAKPYAENAGKAFAGDAAAGVGAGAGIGVYEENQPEEERGPLGTILAGLIGGTAGISAKEIASGAGRVASNKARSLTGTDVVSEIPPDDMFGRSPTIAVADRAAQKVQDVASNPQLAARVIEEENQILDQQGISRTARPTTGVQSDDVGLASLEQNARLGENASKFIERERSVNTEAAAQLENAAPAGADGRRLTDYAESEVPRRVTEVEQQGANDRRAVQSRELPQSDIEDYRGRGAEASRGIDERYRETLSAEKARKNELYNAPELQSAPVDPAPLVAVAEDIAGSLGRLDDPASVPGDIIERVRGLVNEVDEETGETLYHGITFGDIQSLRASVSEQIDQATTAAGRGASGSGPLVGNLKRIRDTLDGYIDELAEGEGSAADAARAAIGNFRDNYAPRFKEGQSGNLSRQMARDPNGTNVRPEDTAGRFLKGNKGSDIDSLDRAIDLNDADNARNARGVLLDDLAQKNPIDAKTGVLKPNVLRRWYDRNQAAVEKVPGLKAKFDEMVEQASEGQRITGEIADELADIDLRVRRETNAIETGPLATAVGKSPKKAVASIMGGNDPERAMRDLVNEVGEEGETRDGLKAAVRDWVVDKATNTAVQKTNDGQRPVSFANLDKLFKEHERTLAELYTPEEMNTLRRVHRLLKPLNNKSMRATVGSDTAEKTAGAVRESRRRAQEVALKGIFGILKGGGINRTVNLAVDSLSGTLNDVDDLIERMWFDPDIAKHLLTRDVEKIGTDEWNRKLGRLILAGQAGSESGKPEDEE